MSPLEQPINFQALALGRHLTIEYYDCNTKVLADVAGMEKLFVDAAVKSGATVLESSFHEFQPQGVSGIVVICESHFAVHAWPEHDYAAVDIFTCGDQIDFELAANALRNALGSRSMVISNVLSRGLIGQNGHLLHEEPNQSVSECSLSWRKRYESVDAWGMLASVDVYDCPDALLNENTVRSIAGNLCEKLNAAKCCSLCNVMFHAPECETGYNGQPYLCNEFGGFMYIPPEKRNKNERWGYHGLDLATPQELGAKISEQVDFLVDNPEISGYCYTQLTDVEQEQNGIYNYDRSEKFPVDIVRKIFSRKPEWSKY